MEQKRRIYLLLLISIFTLQICQATPYYEDDDEESGEAAIRINTPSVGGTVQKGKNVANAFKSRFGGMKRKGAEAMDDALDAGEYYAGSMAAKGLNAVEKGKYYGNVAKAKGYNAAGDAIGYAGAVKNKVQEELEDATDTGIYYANAMKGKGEDALESGKKYASKLYNDGVSIDVPEVDTKIGKDCMGNLLNKMTAANNNFIGMAVGGLKKKMDMEAAILDQVAKQTKTFSNYAGAGIDKYYTGPGGAYMKNGFQMPLNLASSSTAYMAGAKRNAGQMMSDMVKKQSGYTNSAVQSVMKGNKPFGLNGYNGVSYGDSLGFTP